MIGSRLWWKKLRYFVFIALQSLFNVSFHSAIDFCYNDPCQNGGKCVSLPSDFQCDCTPGWEGKDCGSGQYLLGVALISVLRVALEDPFSLHQRNLKTEQSPVILDLCSSKYFWYEIS